MNGDIEVCFFTNNGGVRGNNEDSLLICDHVVHAVSMDTPEKVTLNPESALFCVADGIGGEQKGEVASRMVLESLSDTRDRITDMSSIKKLLILAKERLDTYATEHPDAFNLGTTIAGICIRDDTVFAFNAGDCRVYRINGSYFEQVTQDHSVVQNLFDEGIITEEEMRHHPRRNVVTSSLSGDGNSGSVHVFMTELHLRENDQFFICCDGIWGCFSHDELEMIYRKFPGPEYCDKILGAALARKATDNISAILIRIT